MSSSPWGAAAGEFGTGAPPEYYGGARRSSAPTGPLVPEAHFTWTRIARARLWFTLIEFIRRGKRAIVGVARMYQRDRKRARKIRRV